MNDRRLDDLRTRTPGAKRPHAPPNTARSTPRITSIRSPTWARSIAAGSRVIVESRGRVSVGLGGQPDHRRHGGAVVRERRLRPHANSPMPRTARCRNCPSTTRSSRPRIRRSSNCRRCSRELAPAPFNHFFYCNSGSEGNDTVLRIVHRYWAAARQAAEEGRDFAQERLSRLDDRGRHAGRHGLHARADAVEGRRTSCISTSRTGSAKAAT